MQAARDQELPGRRCACASGACASGACRCGGPRPRVTCRSPVGTSPAGWPATHPLPLTPPHPTHTPHTPPPGAAAVPHAQALCRRQRAPPGLLGRLHHRARPLLLRGAALRAGHRCRRGAALLNCLPCQRLQTLAACSPRAAACAAQGGRQGRVHPCLAAVLEPAGAACWLAVRR